MSWSAGQQAASLMPFWEVRPVHEVVKPIVKMFNLTVIC